MGANELITLDRININAISLEEIKQLQEKDSETSLEKLQKQLQQEKEKLQANENEFNAVSRLLENQKDIMGLYKRYELVWKLD